MKIYFAGSITAGRDMAYQYGRIVEMLREHGTVLTEHVGDENLPDTGEELSPQEINKRDLDWLQESQVIVADLTFPSLGVGYEVGKAEEWNKEILLVSARHDVSPMVIGSPHGDLFIYRTLSELSPVFNRFFSYLQKSGKANGHK